jgi:hypothetical protein
LQARVEVRDAERRRPHVDAPASLAEIEGRSDDGYVRMRHKKFQNNFSPPINADERR